jgi:hypothetical protein
MSTTPVTLDFSKAQPINQAQGVTLDFSKAQPINAGEQINDVGNRVIVPKEGESFGDTMKRAAAYGKTVTPSQINAETASAPGKVATTSLAALGGGFAMPAAEAGVGAVPWTGVAAALAPIAKKYGVKALEGMSVGAGWEVYNALRKHFEAQ